MLLPYMCQQQLCPSNAKDIPCQIYLTCIYGECRSIYMPHMRLLQSMLKPVLVYTDDNNNNADTNDENNATNNDDDGTA